MTRFATSGLQHTLQLVLVQSGFNMNDYLCKQIHYNKARQTKRRADQWHKYTQSMQKSDDLSDT